MIEVREITAVETYAIRQKILRPNQPIEACKYDGDNQDGSFHLGAYSDGELISIASFYHEKYNSFEKENQYRLRGMATLEAYRNQHSGSTLIGYAENLLTDMRADLWWCNARITVKDYYKKLGLKEYGGVFEIKPIGLHQVMYKVLK